MSAEKQFEKIDYKLINKNSTEFITYELNLGNFNFKRIMFKIHTKEIFKEASKVGDLGINLQELKAIQQQIKELGWEE